METVVAIITALGLREVIPRLVEGAVRHWTGRATRERSRVDELVQERDRAEDERDRQARWRRKLQEYASQIRSLLIERGVRPEEIPPWPPEPTRPE